MLEHRVHMTPRTLDLKEVLSRLQQGFTAGLPRRLAELTAAVRETRKDAHEPRYNLDGAGGE